MVQDSMIEQVADTLNQILYGMKLSEMPQSYRGVRLDEAQQVLSAMREPTEAMMQAAGMVDLKFNRVPDRQHNLEMYHAMMDAARAEKLE